MNATKTGMASYSTQELIDYVERTDKKIEAAPAFIRRTSFSRWNSNSAAICAEIQKRQGESKMNTANTLMSIVRFWGEDITAEQEVWLSTEADNLPETEKGKFFDIYYEYEC
tara:strand:- start:46 stop:381 length:336 start_codon:yes stop_codon:yes gene_type:complete